ncbi:MAG TPA: DUF2905 domain-containing protein [Peptococcaceae bacterium]|nr:DUF2905 domain-containing protein [Peptococcaceae bacterium]
MDNFTFLAKMLIGFGAFLILGGLFLLIVGKIAPLGRLPGDILYQRGNFTFYFPLVTCLLLSLLLTILLNLFFWRH